MVSKNILRWANITLNLDQLVILIYRILVIFARGLNINNLPQFKIRVKIKGGLILRFILFSIYVRVKLWNTRLKCALNSRACKNHGNTVNRDKDWPLNGISFYSTTILIDKDVPFHTPLCQNCYALETLDKNYIRIFK